jgi:hypothetical protein
VYCFMALDWPRFRHGVFDVWCGVMGMRWLFAWRNIWKAIITLA